MTTAGHSPPTPYTWKPAGPAMPFVPPPTPPTVGVKASLANREPVALGAAVQSVKELLVAVLAVLFGFGIWTPTIEQVGLLLGLYTALAGSVTGFVTAWVRGRAWAPATVAKLVEGKDG